MSELNNIKGLQELIKQGVQPNESVISCVSRNFLTPGENYGSEIVAVDVVIASSHPEGNCKEETIHLVAKTSPPLELLKEVFNIQVTFKKEAYFYKTIIPLLQQFQKEQNMFEIIESFPDYFTSRLNLNLSTKVDDDAVLLLENLNHSDFCVIDRIIGFDYACTKLIIKDLALFHAIPIALKRNKPEVFKEKILPYIEKSFFYGLNDETKQLFLNGFINLAKSDQHIEKFVPNIERGFTRGSENYLHPKPPKEPFATIIHNDFWVNNVMIKYEMNDPIKTAMVDFQTVEYGSPANDLIFFLFSSVQQEVLEEHYDNFIKLYYSTFIIYLEQLRCNVEEFTWQLFLDEINTSAKETQFFHILMMLKPIYKIKEKAKELKDFDVSDMLSTDNLSENFNTKFFTLVRLFANKKWI